MSFGTEIISITEEIAESPGELYELVYGNSFSSLVICTNQAINEFYLNKEPSQHVVFVTEQKLKTYNGIRLLIKVEKGEHLTIREFFQKRLLLRETNIFNIGL